MTNKKTTPSLQQLVKSITDELLTVNVGMPSAITGHRFAIMTGEYPNEESVGGRCRVNIEALLTKHLKGKIVES